MDENIVLTKLSRTENEAHRCETIVSQKTKSQKAIFDRMTQQCIRKYETIDDKLGLLRKLNEFSKSVKENEALNDSEKKESQKTERQKASLDKMIQQYIRKYKSIDIAWFVNPGPTNHIGILFVFNSVPAFIMHLDDDTSMESGSSNYIFSLLSSIANFPFCSGFCKQTFSRIKPINDPIVMDYFNIRKHEMKDNFIEMSIKSEDQKRAALKVFESIKNVDEQYGNFLMKDCRHYVAAMAYILSQQILPEQSSAKRRSKREMLRMLAEMFSYDLNRSSPADESLNLAEKMWKELEKNDFLPD